MSEQFGVKLNENNNYNKDYLKIYRSLLDSLLFDGYDKILLMYFITQPTAEMNAINIITISIRKLCECTQISKPTVYRHIKKLEEKGVLIKQNNRTSDNGNVANTYKVLNYISVWNCKTFEELKEETDKIKSEVL